MTELDMSLQPPQVHHAAAALTSAGFPEATARRAARILLEAGLLVGAQKAEEMTGWADSPQMREWLRNTAGRRRDGESDDHG